MSSYLHHRAEGLQLVRRHAVRDVNAFAFLITAACDAGETCEEGKDGDVGHLHCTMLRLRSTVQELLQLTAVMRGYVLENDGEST